MEQFIARANGFPDLLGQIGRKIESESAGPLDRLFNSMRDAFSGTCTPEQGIANIASAHIQAKAEMQRLAPDMEFFEPDDCPICGTPTDGNGKCQQPVRDNP